MYPEPWKPELELKSNMLLVKSEIVVKDRVKFDVMLASSSLLSKGCAV